MERLWCASGKSGQRQVSDDLSTFAPVVSAAGDSGRMQNVDEMSSTSIRYCTTGMSRVPEVNVDLRGLSTYSVTVKRGSTGFGFTLTGCSPVQVRRVDHGSPAAGAGLMESDFIVRINGQNVSRSSADSVARLVRECGSQLCLEVQRSQSHPDDSRSVVVVPSCTKASRRQPFASIGNLSRDRVSASQSTSTPRCPVLSSSSSRHHPPAVTAACSNTSQDVIYDDERDSGRVTSSDISQSASQRRHQSDDDDDDVADVPLTVDDDVMMTSRQAAIRRLVSTEKQFASQMQRGVTHYVIALRDCMTSSSTSCPPAIISASEHDTLFNNIEKIQTLATERVALFACCGHQLSAVYRDQMTSLCDAYERYCQCVRDSVRLLVELKQRSSDFADFMRRAEAQLQTLSMSAFIKKPVEHVKDVVLGLQKILSLTAHNDDDYDSLRRVVQTLRNCCNRINEYNLYASSLSLASSSRDTVMPTSSRSSSSSSSSSSVTSRWVASSCSNNSSRTTVVSSIDVQLLDIQTRLCFPSHIQMFNIATASHHLIYSGSLLLQLNTADTRRLTPLFAALMTDLLLLTQPDPDSECLHVLAEPLPLQDVVGSCFQLAHPCDFELSVETYVTSLQDTWRPQSLLLRAPSVELKFTWKNILEQRILLCKERRQQLAASRVADNVV